MSRRFQGPGVGILAVLFGLSWVTAIGPARAAVAGTVAGRLRVEIDGGAVTLEAQNVALVDLLRALALAGGLDLDLSGPLDGRATFELAAVPMRQALRRILEGRNFAVRYAAPDCGRPSAGSAGTLWVFPSRPPPAPGDGGRELPAVRGFAAADGEARARLAVVAELAAAGREPEALAAAALYDPDVTVREEAVHGLGTVDEEVAIRILEQALDDPHRRVRRAAVEAIADLGGDEATWVLAAVLRDEDAALREQAVFALGEIGGEAAATVLRRALADEQGFVREAATDVLKELPP